MDRKALNEWRDSLVAAARANMENDGCVTAVMIMDGGKDFIVFDISKAMNSYETKLAASEQARTLAREASATAVLFISETWLYPARFSNEEMAKMSMEGTMPSSFTDRRDGISFVLEHEGGYDAAQVDVTTDADGKKTFGDVTFEEGRVEGTFSDILPVHAARKSLPWHQPRKAGTIQWHP